MEEHFSMSGDRLHAVQKYARSNGQDEADFTISHGRYSWSVHSKIMSAKSRYFDQLCNGGFKEAQSREVHLTQGSAWDIARSIQSTYIGCFDRRPGAWTPTEGMPLEVLMSHHGLSQEELAAEKSRDMVEIYQAMMELGRYFESASLRRVVAYRLVDSLPGLPGWHHEQQSFDTKQEFAEFLPKLTKAFDIIGTDLHEMPKTLLHLMVDKVLNRMVGQYDIQSKKMPSLLDTGDYTAWGDEVWQNIRAQIESLMVEYLTFGLEMARGYQWIVDAAFKNFKWSTTRVDCLQQYRHH